VQMASRALGAGLVISSGSTPQIQSHLPDQSGAHHVFALQAATTSPPNSPS